MSKELKISTLVKPNSRQESVELLPDGSYLIKVNCPPVDGKANERVVELLSKSMKKPKSAFELISGHKSKKKTFKIT